MTYTVWFEDPAPHDLGRLGGKNASLVSMTAAGMPVPPGFALTADAYRRVFADSGLDATIDALMAQIHPSDPASVALAGQRAREAVARVELPEWLRRAGGRRRPVQRDV